MPSTGNAASAVARCACGSALRYVLWQLHVVQTDALRKPLHPFTPSQPLRVDVNRFRFLRADAVVLAPVENALGREGIQFAAGDGLPVQLRLVEAMPLE